ncbi:unnamed protein product, partial [Ectocarpus sp. 12 AP-2014]
TRAQTPRTRRHTKRAAVIFTSLQHLQGDIRQWLRRRPRVRRWLRWRHTLNGHIGGGKRKTWRTNGSSLLFKNLCGMKEKIKQNG